MAAIAMLGDTGARLKGPVHKIQVLIEYQGQTRSFQMPMGEGKNFKWLALASAQRFCNRPHHGATRQREAGLLSSYTHLPISFALKTTNDREPRPSCPFGSMLLPESVSSPDEDIIYDPEELLVDHLEEESSVRIRLNGPLQRINDCFQPKMTPWSFVAFRTRPALQNDVERFRALLKGKNDELRLKAEEMKGMTRTEIQANDEISLAKSDMMRNIMHQQIISETQTYISMERDWVKMKFLGKLDGLVKRPWEQEKVKALLLLHYPLLTELFRHFASSCSHSDISLTYMNYTEYLHAIQQLGFLPPAANTNDQETFKRIFIECFDERLNDEQRVNSQLKLHQFFLILLQLAYAMYIDKRLNEHLPRLPLHMIGRKRSLIVETTRAPSYDIENALAQVLKNHCIPYAVNRLTTFTVKQAIASKDVLALLAELHGHLFKFYNYYARPTPEGSLYQSIMDIKEFFVMARNCNLLSRDFDESVTPLEVKDVKRSFAFAQTYNGSSHQAGDADEQLIYPEWLEGICRLSVLRYDDPDMPIREKIRLGLNCVMSLARAHHGDSKTSGGSTAGAQQRIAGGKGTSALSSGRGGGGGDEKNKAGKYIASRSPRTDSRTSGGSRP